jgi:hypothetical protein
MAEFKRKKTHGDKHYVIVEDRTDVVRIEYPSAVHHSVPS